MSARVTVNIGFYFEKQHYAQLHAFLPRSQAVKIPELNLQEEKNPEPSPEAQSAKPSRQANGSKKASEEEISEEEDNDNFNEMDIENEEEEDNEIDNEIDQEQQQEVENALQELEEEEVQSESSSSSFDSQREDQEEEEEEEQVDDDSLSEALPTRRFLNHKTKRQKGQTKDLIQLPDRRPRKNKNVDEATEVIRREEKERKRKQYLKKQIEAHEKATIDKILNETGRKLRQRQEKQMQEVMEREQKSYKTLGDVPKVITIVSDQGKTVMTHKTSLFPSFMTTSPDLKMKEMCSNCGNTSKYKLKNIQKFACSLPCYKILAV